MGSSQCLQDGNTKSGTLRVFPVHAKPDHPKSWEVCTVFALLPMGTRVEAGAEAGCSCSSLFLAGAPWAATSETLCYRAQTQLASQAVVGTFQLEKAMAPTFLKDILFSVRNVKCLLISKTIKGDCRTVPFSLGNKGSNMLFSADLKHYSRLNESCITCSLTSLTAPLAPYFPLGGCPICPCPIFILDENFLHNVQIKELTMPCRGDLDRLGRWVHANLRKFRRAKHKVLHRSHSNPSPR